MFDFQPRLQGEILSLRLATPDDFDTLFAVAADPAIWALHPVHDRWQEPVFRAFYDDALADEGGLIAIEQDSGQVIGFSRYSMIHAAPSEVEIGWTFLAWHCWGGRCNGAMKRLMLDHAFRFVNTVIFRIGETNLRSRRAIGKIGVQRIARHEEMVMAGSLHRHLYYAIDKANWSPCADSPMEAGDRNPSDPTD